jgi:hypothetical protein
MSSETNPYSSPEKFGLDIVASHDYADSYEFNIVLLLHKVRKNKHFYYMGYDSGCSCPSPFEDQGIGDLERVRTLAEVEAYVAAHLGYNGYTSISHQVAVFMDKVVLKWKA